MGDTFSLDLSRPATHIDVAPGGEIVLRGSYESKQDGSIVDAVTTTWPKGAPGGESIDAGGLLDLAGGGLHMTSRDPVTHEVRAIAGGDASPACAAAGVAAPCLAVRTLAEARSRLLTVSEWTKSLSGGIAVEVVTPPAYASAVTEAGSAAPYLGALSAIAAVVAGAVLVTRRRRAAARSPRGRLLALARAVETKLTRSDAVFAAPLAPAIAAAIGKVKSRSINPASKEGVRVAAVLARVSARLDETAADARAAEEQAATDELVLDVESALEAAEEAERIAGGSAS